MVVIYHTTTPQNLPNIRKIGLCSPNKSGNINMGSIYAEQGIPEEADVRNTIFGLRDWQDAKNLAYAFSYGHGYPLLLRFNDRGIAGRNGCRRVKRGNETNLVNCECVPAERIDVFQYRDGEWRDLGRLTEIDFSELEGPL